MRHYGGSVTKVRNVSSGSKYMCYHLSHSKTSQWLACERTVGPGRAEVPHDGYELAGPEGLVVPHGPRWEPTPTPGMEPAEGRWACMAERGGQPRLRTT